MGLVPHMRFTTILAWKVKPIHSVFAVNEILKLKIRLCTLIHWL